VNRPANVAAEVVLTGGPSGGKTTGMAYLQRHLSDLGYRVMIVPEVATTFITGGVSDMVYLAMNKPDIYLDVQINLTKAQIESRKRFLSLASAFPEDKVIILHDRGPMDNKAYMSPEQFEVMMAETGFTFSELRDSYDAVLHLVTAAKGAEEAYTLENNTARQETPEQAVEMDDLTLHAWMGHPHLRIIGNETSFEEKLQNTLKEVLHLLGEPEPMEVERKFLLAAAPDISLLPHAQPIEIEQTYLLSEEEGIIRRVRKRAQIGGGATYYITEKRRLSTGETIEKERIISPRKYLKELANADPTRAVIRKTRYCFAYEGSYFELDQFHTPQGLWLLEVELSDLDQLVEIPDFLWIAKEVTDDPAFKNETLAETAI
jgi:CYTH domain-containing protein/predicted ATPase